MSYCRWSSEGFLCDIYCYLSENTEYVIHVAASKIILDENYPNPIEFEDPRDFYLYNEKLMSWLETAKRREIGLPYDGKSFHYDNPKDAAERLIKLRNIGYNVPQYVIDELLLEDRMANEDYDDT